VLSQFKIFLRITYDQNNWNKYNYYQQIDKNQITEFWTLYNKQLVVLIKNTSSENILRECVTSDGKAYTSTFSLNNTGRFRKKLLKHFNSPFLNSFLSNILASQN
jgi:hypothetical protein